LFDVIENSFENIMRHTRLSAKLVAVTCVLCIRSPLFSFL
ncbi:MAG: hypothetical protein ACI8RD_009208, partial [Bacillariaceae sp.]